MFSNTQYSRTLQCGGSMSGVRARDIAYTFNTLSSTGPQLFISSLTDLYHVPSMYTIHSNILHVQQLLSWIFYTYLHDTLLTVNLTKIIWIYNCWLIPTCFNCNCILVLTILKMATWVAETCWWLLCNKLHSYTRVHVLVFLNILHICLTHGISNI
jgi:hypothetical protein